MKLCECGCGNPVTKEGNRFIQGHTWKNRCRPPFSEQTKKRMSDSRKGKKRGSFTAEHKKNLSESLKGKPKSKEHREKISRTLMGQNKDKTYEERYGVEKAKELRKIRSKKFVGENNPQFGKPAWNSGLTKGTDERLEIVSCKVRRFRKGKKWDEVMSNAENAKRKRRVYLLNGGAAHALSFIKNPSKPQRKLYEMVCSVYPSAVLNYPVLNYSIDVAISEYKIAIEYDGSYWHQDEEKDLKRQKNIEEAGWKFLRYRDFLPNKDELLRDIECVIYKGYNPIFIDQHN